MRRQGAAVILFGLGLLGWNGGLRAQGADVPVGTVVAMAADVPHQRFEPDWIACDGRSLLIDENLALFASVGWTYGLGDDPEHRTTFSAPDFRGYFLRGLSGATDRDPDKADRHDPLNAAVSIGDVIGSVQEDTMQSHRHPDKGHAHPTNAAAQTASEWSDNSDDRKVGRPDPPAASVSTGYANLGDPVDSGTGAGLVRHSAENRPKNVGILWLIRAR